MRVINQHHAMPLYPRERTPVPIEYEAETLPLLCIIFIPKAVIQNNESVAVNAKYIKSN